MLKSLIYKDAKIFGPYLNRVKQRQEIVIYFANKIQITMHFSRFLMQEFIGRILESNEEVDYIDENKLNDDIGNLQILTGKDNHNKTHRKYFEPITVICYYCEKPFLLTPKQQLRRAEFDKKGKAGPFCNPRCSGLYSKAFRSLV